MQRKHNTTQKYKSESKIKSAMKKKTHQYNTEINVNKKTQQLFNRERNMYQTRKPGNHNNITTQNNNMNKIQQLCNAKINLKEN